MKTTIRNGLIVSVLSATLLNAGDNAIEIDPATYGFDGYSVHLKHTFDALPKTQFGVGVYAMDFPDIFVDMHSKNKDRGWNVRLERGIGLFADIYLEEKQSGWFYGGQLAQQKYKIDRLGKGATYNTLLLMAHGGYKYDINEHFYLKLWGGVGYSHKYSGQNRVDDLIYDVPKVVPFGALHIGYQF